MSDKKTDLRKQAEQKAAHLPKNIETMSPEEVRLTLHELRVHQIELEMQNEELREAQLELGEARTRYFDLYDLAPVGYCTISEKGLILEANLTAATMLGLTHRGALAKLPLSQYIFKEDHDIYYLHRKQLFETDEGQPCELRMVKMDGTLFWACLETTAAKGADGTPTYRMVISNITGRIDTEKELRKSQEQLRDAHRLAHIGIWNWNADTDTVIWTEELYRIAGLDPMTPAPTYAEHLHIYAPESWDLLKVAVAKALKTGAPYQLELELIRPDGTSRMVNAFGGATHDKQGRTTGLYGTVQDITERKRIENERQIFQDRLAMAQQIAHVGSWEYNLETGEIWGSEEAIRIYGLSSETGEFPIDQIEACIPEREKVHQALLNLIEHEKAYDLAFAINPADGNKQKFISSKAELIKDAKGKPVKVAGVIQDITKSKQADEEKAKLQGQLLQAQKMESVGRLAGGVAHDFNNKLGVIIGYTEMALDQVDPKLPLHADLEQIRTAANHAADLTRQLLAFARKQTVAPKVLDLNKTVTSMLKMLQRLIGENIHINWQPDANLWPIKVDPSQIDQILTNLCINARDAISNVGKITIETGNIAFDEDYCAAYAGFLPGEYVLLAVSDNGCGMDKETLSYLFEPFYTTKVMGKGTGLGLATVYGIIMQNNGLINVYSEPDKGTTFRIYLPRHVGKTGDLQAKGPVEPTSRGHETILLVEDDPSILEMTTRMLKKQGYTVLSANSPGEAIHLARERTGEIHLLMTDVVMPEMNGRDLAKNLLSLFPHLKRLFMSGYTADVIAHHGVLDEGVYFIQKPFSIKDLASKVREALDLE